MAFSLSHLLLLYLQMGPGFAISVAYPHSNYGLAPRIPNPRELRRRDLKSRAELCVALGAPSELQPQIGEI